MSQFQTTIGAPVSIDGVGVHSGLPVSMQFAPAAADTGVVFRRSEGGQDVMLRAVVDQVQTTALSTVLGSPTGLHVATVEHVMATLMALGIDNVTIDVDGPEVPILDGSARMLVEALDRAGVEVLDARRRHMKIVKPVRIEQGGSWAEFVPGEHSRFEIEIDFASPAIGRQALALDLDADSFRSDVADARTFGFVKDVERLWAAGKALGSSLENSIVIDDEDRLINVDGLRYSDEFVRHKMLDAIGDLALAGARLVGTFRSYRGSHTLNVAALRALLADRTAYQTVEA